MAKQTTRATKASVRREAKALLKREPKDYDQVKWALGTIFNKSGIGKVASLLRELVEENVLKLEGNTLHLT